MKEEIQNDEITLRELILKLKEFWVELWNNKTFIILFTLPFLAYMIYKAYTTPLTYTAETRFIVEGQSSSGGLSGLLGQFGMKGGGGKTNPYTILEVAKSKELMKELAFNKAQNSGDYIANIIIKEYNFGEKWKVNHPEMEHFIFKTDSVNYFNEEESRAFLSVYQKINGIGKNHEDAIFKINFDEDTGIFAINTESVSEELTLSIAEIGFERIKYFFEERTLESQKNTRDLLKSKVDSLQALVTGKTYSLGKFDDANRNLISSTAGSVKSNISRDIAVLSLALGEAMKSYEYADYSYRDSKPQFLKIDSSISPLEPDKRSKLGYLIRGGLLGGLLASGFVIGRKIFKDAMAE